MKVGFMGLGKLGLCCALAIEAKGHKVKGYDIDPNVERIIRTRKLPYREEGAQELLDYSNIEFVDVEKLVRWSEIIFVPIQTPHSPEYEGITRLPNTTKDFDYTFLKAGIKDLSEKIEKNGENKVVVIISTVLPGTIRREIKPLLGKHTKLCYNPFFIAMGTTVNDFLNPEFVLFGMDDEWAAEVAEEFYSTIHFRPFVRMSIESAELTKVAYNTFITSKIVITNILMEVCHKVLGADIDDVMGALKLATDRVVSTKYLNGGMGDGGGCHPRDNIALSWLAEKLDLSHDIYREFMLAREAQCDWFADLIQMHRKIHCLQSVRIVLLGKSFKKETNLTIGSPAVLLRNILFERGEEDVVMWDPHVDGFDAPDFGVAVYFISTNHDEFLDFKF